MCMYMYNVYLQIEMLYSTYCANHPKAVAVLTDNSYVHVHIYMYNVLQCFINSTNIHVLYVHSIHCTCIYIYIIFCTCTLYIYI